MSGSKFLKRLLRVALVAVLLLAAAAVAVYVAASWVPGQYHPADLPARQRNVEGQRFLAMVVETRNKVQVREPFSVSISEEELNNYLASMDEIVALVPNRKPGEVRGPLERLGLAEPSAAIGEGVLTLMIRLSEYGKVVSADVSFEFLPDDQLQIRLGAVRVGRLTVPQSLIRGPLQQAREKLAAGMRHTLAGEPERSSASVSIEEVSALLGRAVAAIDEKPISTDLGKYHQRIAGVELHDKTLTLRFQPTETPRPTPPH
jgi:hypothetical protein